ncbi:5-(carboxyamino)imidazole ribonucleotide synthase [Coraliomargarita akajimensis]|uniref:N5-carboxyaminoimidazole ribonucleotide synthase n=1 Tax=Coraliomargarita akajimensis (strain DSM 45221 / IAM 15411 / JCM 23193 / KCTC 12865 / 04OKA010-24) TaxID=583355 RepID=D5EL98_CORAD|nr:5-(carboxyamino)imidazole ribonucleotide synthase [Coraliomargarita akajimensis]ADE55034.1 phosphoribosylaminoimidazole carboxylase, ATPase subunit [Coraliomargarita akajimensis DSM 45221]
MITPGQTIGVLGGGQLGRMLMLAGRALGYRFHVFEPKGPCAAGMVADKEINAEYSDEAALKAFAEGVDVITLEFENIPAEVVDMLSAIKPVLPGKQALHICQHRQREKDFLKSTGLPCAPFEYADSAASLKTAIETVGTPCVIKTAAFGYDGKGQIKINAFDDSVDCDTLWTRLGEPPRVVIEKWIHHAGEFSVICARKADGSKITFPMAENVHVDHILHASIVPARVTDTTREAGEALARDIADKLEVVGLIAVELFLDEDGSLIVNEMAPRPHNSGHYTMDGCVTSQFEQHIRAVTNLPFGSTRLHCPTVMINLLGDVWKNGEPDWSGLLADPMAKLHLYDKGEPRPARKMGHFTILGDDVDATLASAEAHFARLTGA